MKSLTDLKIKIFADGADLQSMKWAATNPLIKGFTTNPTLMRAAGVTDYKAFALDVLKAIPDKPVSFEVFADDFSTMEKEACEIASWGENVYVKIPVTNTTGEMDLPMFRSLSREGIKLNITAVFTTQQVRYVAAFLESAPAIISVFAGRIADTGRNPMPLMRAALAVLKYQPNIELLWASPRELLNIFQADEVGCHIITVPPDIVEKLPLVGRDLSDYSRETVTMFHRDAAAAGLKIEIG